MTRTFPIPHLFSMKDQKQANKVSETLKAHWKLEAWRHQHNSRHSWTNANPSCPHCQAAGWFK